MKAETFSIGSKFYPNEDSLVVQNMGIYGIAAVLADGMGGLSLGDVAASIVTRSVVSFLMDNYQGYAERDILLRALRYADESVRKTSIEKRSNMGAAVAAAIVIDCQLFCIWQGNVRIYVYNHKKLNLITEDHIADIGYGHTALTRCVKGGGLRDDLPFICYELSKDDVIFICTDGLYKSVESCLGISS